MSNIEPDPELSHALTTHRFVEQAIEDANAVGAFIASLRDRSGIDNAEELCSLAHHWLEKVLPDATPLKADEDQESESDDDAKAGA